MADFEPNPDYYLPPRPKMPARAPDELRAGEISDMPPWYKRPVGALNDELRALGRYFGYQDFDTRTSDALNLLSLFGLAASPARYGVAALDQNIANSLTRYAPKDSTRTIAGGADDYWNTSKALARNDGTINAARPSYEVSNGVTQSYLRNGQRDPIPFARNDNSEKLLTMDPVKAAEAVLARNPNDPRAKYMLALERQKAAQTAQERAQNITRFREALTGKPRDNLTVIDGGKMARGGAVNDPMAMAMALAQRYMDTPRR